MFLTMLFTGVSSLTNAQNNSIIVQQNITLPKDSIVSNQLIKSLNGFLSLKDKSNSENSFVLKEDLLETSVLLDEMKGIEKSIKFKDDNFYKCYLSNIIQLKDSIFLIQFSYIGVNENSPILAASFEILAKIKNNNYYFSSPLKHNTAIWKAKKIGDVTFHYKNILNDKSIKAYEKKVRVFDLKLKSTNKTIEWYGFDDMNEMLNAIGVSYKLEYNSRKKSTFTAIENNSLLIASATGNIRFDDFDPHDLWHERLYNIVPKKTINKPIDEGSAYLYGGSWGISWNQILKTFKEKVSSNPKTDWLATYEDFYNFGESKEKHLLTPYVINALIIEKLEREKGFLAVIELLSCGKYQKGNENYFIALEKLTGINKSNYNERVWKLINESGK